MLACIIYIIIIFQNKNENNYYKNTKLNINILVNNMLILDNIDSKYHGKFTHDFDKLLKNHDNVNICFGIKNSSIKLPGFRNILFKIDDYDNIEKKIIKRIICYFLMLDDCKYMQVETKTYEDSIIYAINLYDVLKLHSSGMDKNYNSVLCDDGGYKYYPVCNNASCNLPVSYNIIYDKNNNNINYYIFYNNHRDDYYKYCAYHNKIDHYDISSLFNSQYEKIKLSNIINDTSINNVNNEHNNNDNNIITNNSMNNVIQNNINNSRNNKITIQVITDITNISMDFLNINFEQVIDKLTNLFGNGRIIFEDDTYKFIKN